MTEEEKINAGILFCPSAPELRAMKKKAHDLNREYNATCEDDTEKRSEIISQLIGETGEGCTIQGPVFFHYGVHTKIGKNFFANFNFTVQDDAEVTIGDNCNFGPNVTLVTPIHPMLPSERERVFDSNKIPRHMCYAKPVHIGNDCWLGANVVVCSGVSVGDGCVIGAGSVVVKDIPPLTFAAGNPCRVIREITESDSMKYKPEILSDNTVE
ncbi:MAG: sugar O-acetyltransferase [Clostridiales bacterium]|nr:sugar O-acetyltransferase [Clostridiales bacterium]